MCLDVSSDVPIQYVFTQLPTYVPIQVPTLLNGPACFAARLLYGKVEIDCTALSAHARRERPTDAVVVESRPSYDDLSLFLVGVVVTVKATPPSDYRQQTTALAIIWPVAWFSGARVQRRGPQPLFLQHVRNRRAACGLPGR